MIPLHISVTSTFKEDVFIRMDQRKWRMGRNICICVLYVYVCVRRGRHGNNVLAKPLKTTTDPWKWCWGPAPRLDEPGLSPTPMP
ncbi:hypothetical protein HanIR_Chr12g0596381 [Helianthus annuus]|nr:hypothetical protein HanIR_Chr12g0596381 [Helianthus annuus]